MFAGHNAQARDFATEVVRGGEKFVEFSEIRIGDSFRLITGIRSMTKLTSSTADFSTRKTIEFAHEFDGSERCVLAEVDDD